MKLKNNYISNPKIGVSIEARMGSSRLPGKVLMDVLGKPLLSIMIDRVSKSKLIHDIVVATTINPLDDQIEKFCQSKGVKCFRGSEPDVLDRVLRAHQFIKSDIIVELTGDCPLIDPKIIDLTINDFLSGEDQIDYATSIQIPRRIPDGMDVDVFKTSELEEISRTIFDSGVREHISPYFWKSGRYKCSFLKLEQKYLRDYSVSVTLDTLDDYHLIKSVHEELFPKNENYDLSDILNFFDHNRKLISSNG